MITEKTKRIFLVVFLIVLDQGIKLLISSFFMDIEFDIVGELVFFRPVLNTKLSWINSWLNLGIGFTTHVLVNFLILFIGFYVYKYCSSKYKINKTVYCAYIFFLPGALCSLIDKIFWGGSLDYIGIKNFFIFDMKDIYLTASQVLFIVFYILYSIKNPQILKISYKRDMLEIKKFFGYMIKDIFGTRNKEVL